MDRNEFLFEIAMNGIDVRFIEEPIYRKTKNSSGVVGTVFARRKAWILCVAAVLISLIAVGTILAVSGLFKPHNESVPTDVDHTKEPIAISAEERILLLVAEKNGSPIADGLIHYDVDGYYASDFAPYYGGAYRNAEGQLVVCLVEAAGQETIDHAKEKLGNDCDVFREVKYSYSDLINIMSDLSNYYHSGEYAAESFTITGFEIDASENTVQVSVVTSDEDAINKIRDNVRIPEAVRFSIKQETGVPAEPHAPQYYGVHHCERDAEIDDFVCTMADEMLEGVIVDPAFYHAEDRDLNDLYILAPFKLWKETETGLVEVEDFFQYPVASNGRVICTIIVTRVGAELHYSVSDMYVIELNKVCNDNRNRIVVFNEEAFEMGDHEKAIRMMLLPDDDGSEHSVEENIFINVSGKYQ